MGDYKNTACFIARCQPFHSGHKEIIDILLDEGKEVIVAIYDTTPDDRNPLSPYERTKIIQEVYGDRVRVVVVPAFGILVYGRGVGYKFREFPDLGGSAGEIRESHRIVWLTGQSGAGKSALAEGLRKRFCAVVLDGDDMRSSISREFGYDLTDRRKSAERTARLARELVRQQNVIIASIGATEKIRTAVGQIINPIWVYVKRTSADREGYPYEPPVAPTITVDNDAVSLAEGIELVWSRLLHIVFYDNLEQEETYVHI